jgi:hypothetical protein
LGRGLPGRQSGVSQTREKEHQRRERWSGVKAAATGADDKHDRRHRQRFEFGTDSHSHRDKYIGTSAVGNFLFLSGKTLHFGILPQILRQPLLTLIRLDSPGFRLSPTTKIWFD